MMIDNPMHLFSPLPDATPRTPSVTKPIVPNFSNINNIRFTGPYM